MLRTIRLTLAVIFFALITLLFLDFTGTLHTWFGWMAKIQFLPAVLALNIGVVLFLAVLTLVFGRIYCSVICPLGVFQDIVSRLSAKRKKNRLLLARIEMATLRRAGSIRTCHRRRAELFCRATGPLQLIRAHRFQPFLPALPVGKQRTGLPGRTCRQLCLL